jgi:hypothetical protein
VDGGLVEDASGASVVDGGLVEDASGASVVDGGLVEAEATEVVAAIEPVATVGSANSEPPPQATSRATRTLRPAPIIRTAIAEP